MTLLRCFGLLLGLAMAVAQDGGLRPFAIPASGAPSVAYAQVVATFRGIDQTTVDRWSAMDLALDHRIVLDYVQAERRWPGISASFAQWQGDISYHLVVRNPADGFQMWKDENIDMPKRVWQAWAATAQVPLPAGARPMDPHLDRFQREREAIIARERVKHVYRTQIGTVPSHMPGWNHPDVLAVARFLVWMDDRDGRKLTWEQRRTRFDRTPWSGMPEPSSERGFLDAIAFSDVDQTALRMALRDLTRDADVNPHSFGRLMQVTPASAAQWCRANWREVLQHGTERSVDGFLGRWSGMVGLAFIDDAWMMIEQYQRTGDEAGILRILTWLSGPRRRDDQRFTAALRSDRRIMGLLDQMIAAIPATPFRSRRLGELWEIRRRLLGVHPLHTDALPPDILKPLQDPADGDR